MPKYTPLLEEYAQNLEKRVAAGEIKENTRDTYLRDASRLFEALVCWALSEDLLNKATQSRSLGGNYGKVARDLKAIVDKRNR